MKGSVAMRVGVFVVAVLVAVSLVLVSCGDGYQETAVQNSSEVVQDDLIFADAGYGLATHRDTNDVYLIKQQNGQLFKRLILNPEIFDSYGFNWDSVRVIEAESLISIASISVVMDQDMNLYYLYSTKDADTGVKQLITFTVDELVACGFDRDVIFFVQNWEMDEKHYKTMRSVADSCDDLP